MDNKFTYIVKILFIALFLKFFLINFLDSEYPFYQFISIFMIFTFGVYVLTGAANIIEETTEVISERTSLAGGVVQSFGTAFPDMVIGIIAALISLRLRRTDIAASINFAIIAAATTFGSNIYNIGHAAWCIFRQNIANQNGHSIQMFPHIAKGGKVIPLKQHERKPTPGELDVAIDILNALTILTAAVAFSMVGFGRVDLNQTIHFNGDLYQLVRPLGILVFIISVYIMYRFRKTRRPESELKNIVVAEKYYRSASALLIWSHLLFSGIAILLAAESMVHAVRIFCEITGVPLVVAGVLTGFIGCLGEMIVIHNYSIHPKGRLGDALTGVGMDNIMTLMGASIVAVMGGIFMGGRSLIIIFVAILTLNTVLIWQISRLKNFLFTALQ